MEVGLIPAAGLPLSAVCFWEAQVACLESGSENAPLGARFKDHSESLRRVPDAAWREPVGVARRCYSLISTFHLFHLSPPIKIKLHEDQNVVLFSALSPALPTGSGT